LVVLVVVRERRKGRVGRGARGGNRCLGGGCGAIYEGAVGVCLWASWGCG